MNFSISILVSLSWAEPGLIPSTIMSISFYWNVYPAFLRCKANIVCSGIIWTCSCLCLWSFLSPLIRCHIWIFWCALAIAYLRNISLAMKQYRALINPLVVLNSEMLLTRGISLMEFSFSFGRKWGWENQLCSSASLIVILFLGSTLSNLSIKSF